MTKSEMLKNWKETSAIKSDFTKTLGERFPHMCYTDTKLLAKIQKTLTSLTEELKKVANGEPDKPIKAKAKTEDTEPAKSETEDATKLAEVEVKTPAKAKQAKPEAVKA